MLTWSSNKSRTWNLYQGQHQLFHLLSCELGTRIKHKPGTCIKANRDCEKWRHVQMWMHEHSFRCAAYRLVMFAIGQCNNKNRTTKWPYCPGNEREKWDWLALYFYIKRWWSFTLIRNKLSEDHIGVKTYELIIIIFLSRCIVRLTIVFSNLA